MFLSKMFLNIIFIFIVVYGCVESLNYDQRQNGDYNVQVDVKDVAIFAILNGEKEEYVDYDYAYDYSQLTIKPQNRTTPKPLNSSSDSADYLTDATPTVTTLYYEPPTKITINTVNSTDAEREGSNLITTTEVPLHIITTKTSTTDNLTESTVIRTDTIVTNSTVANTSSENPICKKGFVLNNKKECQPRLSNFENGLRKIVQLSLKHKLRRENMSNNH